jgi:hypothetical protein
MGDLNIAQAYPISVMCYIPTSILDTKLKMKCIQILTISLLSSSQIISLLCPASVLTNLVNYSVQVQPALAPSIFNHSLQVYYKLITSINDGPSE